MPGHYGCGAIASEGWSQRQILRPRFIWQGRRPGLPIQRSLLAFSSAFSLPGRCRILRVSGIAQERNDRDDHSIRCRL